MYPTITKYLSIYPHNRAVPQQLEKFGSEFLHQSTEKVPIGVCQQTVFDAQPTRSPDLNPLAKYQTPAPSAPPVNEQNVHRRIFMAVKPSATAPGRSKGCGGP